MERLNELQVFKAGDRPHPRASRTCSSRRPIHPFWEHWWPPGHIIGWGETFVHELHHFLAAIADDTDVAPHGATFEDGYRAAEVCDAIVRSGEIRHGGSRSHIGRRNALTSTRFVLESPRRHPSSRRICSEGSFS